jgi:hypothetical protein
VLTDVADYCEWPLLAGTSRRLWHLLRYRYVLSMQLIWHMGVTDQTLRRNIRVLRGSVPKEVLHWLSIPVCPLQRIELSNLPMMHTEANDRLALPHLLDLTLGHNVDVAGVLRWFDAPRLQRLTVRSFEDADAMLDAMLAVHFLKHLSFLHVGAHVQPLILAHAFGLLGRDGSDGGVRSAAGAAPPPSGVCWMS